MTRVTASFFLALVTAAVAAGESVRGLAALRDGWSWAQAAVTALGGLVLFLSLVILLRITVAVGRSQRRRRLKTG